MVLLADTFCEIEISREKLVPKKGAAAVKFFVLSALSFTKRWQTHRHSRTNGRKKRHKIVAAVVRTATFFGTPDGLCKHTTNGEITIEK